MITVELNKSSVAVYDETGLRTHTDRPATFADVDLWLMGEGLLRNGEFTMTLGADGLNLYATVADVAAEVAAA